MKLHGFFVAAACLALAADKSKDNVVKAELEKLQGTWQLISAETDGKKLPEETVKKIRVVIKGNKHTVHFGDKVVAKQIPFTLDPTKKPKTTDDTLPDGKQIFGIYELKGDILKSCVAGIGKNRPKKFAAAQGSGHTLRVFKRLKQ